MARPAKIGEGSYGCVFKPSIKCKNEKSGNDTDISKLMVDNEADDEMSKYNEIQKIDRDNKYHLTPRTCVPDDSVETKGYVLGCKDGNQIIGDYENYKFLVMKYGGPSLTQLFGAPMENTASNRERVNRFWINGIQLFKAIILFNENGLIHHDMKPENIVYDESINSLKIIDYGLQQFKDKIIRKSQESKYNDSRFHFNYPPELAVYNKNTFDNIKKLEDGGTSDRPHMYFRGDVENSYHYAMSGLMSYIENETLHPQRELLFEDDFFSFLEKDKLPYAEFLDRSVDTIDMYGLGMSLIYVLAKSYELMESQTVKKLDSLFSKMIHPDIQQRIKLSDAFILYQNIIRGLPALKQSTPPVLIATATPLPPISKDYEFTSSELMMSSPIMSSKKGGRNARHTKHNIQKTGKKPRRNMKNTKRNTRRKR